MKKTDETTPLQNLLNEDLSDPRNNQYISEFISLRPDNMSSIELNKLKLGKQKYCITTGISYCWVWEGENWRAYVSKEGLSFEVLPTLSIDQAWEAWQEYRSLVSK